MEQDRAASTPAPRRTLYAGIVLLLAVLAIFILGRAGYLPDAESVLGWARSLADSPWGLPAIIAVFCVAAFIGVPQFALIAASVAIFGPWLGAAYAWIANMTSGALTFWVGRLAGEPAFRRYAGKRAQKLSGFVGRNALAASALVRIMPSGPFLIVNMAFGVSHAKFRDYWMGMGLGILPKIALIAFAGRSLFAAIEGNPLIAVAAAMAAILVYGLIVWFVRRRTRLKRQFIAPGPSPAIDTDLKPSD